MGEQELLEFYGGRPAEIWAGLAFGVGGANVSAAVDHVEPFHGDGGQQP